MTVTGKPRPELQETEHFWLNHRDWLGEKGYVLRARYQEGWVPSWLASKKYVLNCEDAMTHGRGNVMDATRVEDGKFVMLKKIRKEVDSSEVEIATWFSAEPQRSDPENHCVPIFEVLQTSDPAVQLIVMPLLTRYDKPRFDTIGEAVSFFRQIFRGLKYMHKQNVAHRDCSGLNIMMDASQIFTKPFHPADWTMKRDFSGRTVPLSRTQHPVKYYITDFGFSTKYKAEDRPPLETPMAGADPTVPEFQQDDAPDCDPFPVDVYYIGNLIRREFILGNSTTHTSRKRGFDFMEPLMADMVNTDPSLRPSMDEVVDRFEELVRGLSSWKLRSRVAKDKHSFGVFLSISHWIRKSQLVVGRYPAIPMP
ncbi:kinase-like domain-containing protein [Mycena crocata]|nr:kinase-like domain-containing protein [Mycena crocata]